MKRSYFGALVVAGSAVLTLSACGNGSYDQLEKAPVTVQRDTLKPRAQVTACISRSLSGFGSDLGVFPDDSSGTTTVTLGGDDSGTYRHYYQINIVDQTRGSEISVRHSKSSDRRLAVQQMTDIVTSCAN